MTSQMPLKLGYSISTSFFPLHTHWVPPRPTSQLPLVEGSRMMAVAGRAAAAKGFIALHWEFHCCSTEKKEDKGLQLDHWVSLGLLGMGGEPERGGTQRKREEQYLPVHKWDWTYGYLMRGEGRNWAPRKMCERKKYKWEEEEGWRVRE